MKDYYEKYIKYKKKYLKLKNSTDKINIAWVSTTNESYTGEGFYFEEKIENKDEYYLYTSGLIGCVGIFITFNYNDKKLVWLTHVLAGTTTEQFSKLYSRICLEISKLIDFEVTPENIRTFEDFKLYLVNLRGLLYNSKMELNLENLVVEKNIIAYTGRKDANYGADRKQLFEIIEEYFTNIQKLDFVKLYGNTIIYEFYVSSRWVETINSKLVVGLHDSVFIKPRLSKIEEKQKQ